MSHQETPSAGRSWPVLAAIGALLAAYVAAAASGWPQRGAELVALAQQEPVGHETTAADGEAEGHGVVPPGGGEIVGHPPYWMVAPFALLLLAIAVLPLVPGAAHWWESNLNRFLVAGGLGLATLAYYLVLFDRPVVPEWPAHGAMTQPDRAGLDYGVSLTVLENAILGEYIPFITLLFALYTISGGIRIQGDLPAWPSTNAAFLAVGALLANLIGTTGAAMLLIRPLLETNSERRHVKHTVVFFIFAVCNCGGCLTPLGDPPLFLGYLRGVDFLWTVRLWPEWLFVNGSLVVIYYLWDRWWAYPKETPRDLALDETRVRGLQFMGVWPNAALLVGVVLAVALLDPSKPLPGTAWRPWMYLREATQLTLVALSLLLGSAAVRRMNQFNFAAIIEVAALFFGIFLCMQPPLQILHVRGPSLGLATPAHFFWATGSLSSVLDNAPTYVVFFETARSLPSAGATVAGVAEPLLAAVSLGAVFMGAMTYIGNGPNFMVRAIAEKSGIAMPSFFGYLAYSVLVLVPLFAACTWLFL